MAWLWAGLLLAGLMAWLSAAPAAAQISAGGQPPGLRAASMPPAPTIRLASLPEGARRTPPPHAGKSARLRLLPNRYGTRRPLALRLREQGAMQRLKNGGRRWHLRITASGARALRLSYNRFRIPPGATFFVYDPAGRTVRGAFTARNNTAQNFATDLTLGETVVLEYYEPPDPAFAGHIHLDGLVHAHSLPRPLAGTNDAALPCSINTACPMAAPWRDEARATVLLDRGGSTCSGVLVNNVRKDFTPYILTAHHCGSPAVGDTLNWTVTFNHASPTCEAAAPPPARSMVGAVVRAASSHWQEDVLLIELLNPIPAHYRPYFAGWSRAAQGSRRAVTISYPQGDVRGIAFDEAPLQDMSSRWIAAFDRGTIEPGSSGAPLFNADHQLVGHLRGAWTLDPNTCSGPGGDDNRATIVFPKLSHVWTSGPPGARIADFLDPLSTGRTTLEGLDGALPASTPAVWISEMDAVPTGNGGEFVELAGPPGIDLSGYRLDVYACAAGRAIRQHTVSIAPHAPLHTVSDAAWGFFVVGASASAGTVDQAWPTAAPDVLPDGHGLVVLRAPSGRAVFDYQYDRLVDGVPRACPAAHVTRSEGDDYNYTAATKAHAPNTAMGFTTTAKPLSSDPGTPRIFPTPGRPNTPTRTLQSTFRLSAPAPNPFRTRTRLTLTVDRSQHVHVAAYDVLGRRVARLYEGPVPASTPVPITFAPPALPSGWYVIRVQGEHFAASRNVIRLR